MSVLDLVRVLRQRRLPDAEIKAFLDRNRHRHRRRLFLELMDEPDALQRNRSHQESVGSQAVSTLISLIDNIYYRYNNGIGVDGKLVQILRRIYAEGDIERIKRDLVDFGVFLPAVAGLPLVGTGGRQR